jgi:co-chaperonin GroES (HSP10)
MKITKLKDGNLKVTDGDKDWIVGYSADGYNNPYGIVLPNEDTFRMIHKDRSAKMAWKKLKPMVDKHMNINEASDLVHAYEDDTLKKLWGTGELVKGKDKKIGGVNHKLVRFDRDTQKYWPENRIKIAENKKMNEGKYNTKADALNAYFQGKISAQELDNIAKTDFKSSVATKRELTDFLKNGFTQDVMADTYGIPKNTLVKKARELVSFAESVSIIEGVRVSLINPNTNKAVKTIQLDTIYREAEEKVEKLNSKLSDARKNKGLYWKVMSIGENVNEAKLDDLMKRATEIKSELNKLKADYSKNRTETNKAKVAAKEEQLKRVAKVIRIERAKKHENLTESTQQLKVGDKISVEGFVMLKGLDGGSKYKVIKADDFSYTFQKIGSSKKVRHYSADVDRWLNKPRGDNNQIIKEQLTESDNLGRVKKKGGEYYVDSNFINSCQNLLSGWTLKHAGFGEFYLQTPKGKIQFARMSERFPNFVGRTHRMYDDADDKIVTDLIKAMINQKKAIMENINEASKQLSYRTNKNGYVISIFDSNAKRIKDVVVGGKKYRWDSVHKTYNSIDSNELLHKNDVDKHGMRTENINERKFKRGDKVKTRDGNVETVIRINSNGNVETKENDYSWSPETLTLVNEGRAFVAAAKKAKEEGKTEFEFDGKTYPVTIKETIKENLKSLNISNKLMTELLFFIERPTFMKSKLSSKVSRLPIKEALIELDKYGIRTRLSETVIPEFNKLIYKEEIEQMKITKNELRQVIREEIKRLTERLTSPVTDNKWTETQQFRDEFIKRFSKKLNIRGWTVSDDDRTGTFYWFNPKVENEVLATPFWEDNHSIPVNVIDMEGEDILDTNVPFKPTYDFEKDAKEYIKKMTQVLSKVK